MHTNPLSYPGKAEGCIKTIRMKLLILNATHMFANNTFERTQDTATDTRATEHESETRMPSQESSGSASGTSEDTSVEDKDTSSSR